MDEHSLDLAATSVDGPGEEPMVDLLAELMGSWDEVPAVVAASEPAEVPVAAAPAVEVPAPVVASAPVPVEPPAPVVNAAPVAPSTVSAKPAPGKPGSPKQPFEKAAKTKKNVPPPPAAKSAGNQLPAKAPEPPPAVSAPASDTDLDASFLDQLLAEQTAVEAAPASLTNLAVSVDALTET